MASGSPPGSECHCCLSICALILPPAAVTIAQGKGCPTPNCCIALLLMFLGWVPAVAFACFIIHCAPPAASVVVAREPPAPPAGATAPAATGESKEPELTV